VTNHTPPHPVRPVRAWLKHALQLGLGLALFATVLYLTGLDSLRQLTHLRWLPLVGGFIATVGITASIALRWSTLTNALLGRPVTGWLRFCQYFLWNRVLGFVVPKDLTDLGGRAMALVARHDVPLRYAVASVLLDRGFDLLTVALFLGPALLFLSKTVRVGTAVALMVLLALSFYAVLRLAHRSLLASMVRFYNRASRLVHRLPSPRHRPPWKVESPNLSLEALTQAYLFGLSKFLCTALRFMFFALALDLPVSPLVFLLGMPVGQLSFLFAFTPGGLGILEAGWYAVLMQIDVPEAYISPFLVEQRVFTMLFVGILALLSSLLTLSRPTLKEG
jgi:uncharacterized protein (TIRG00374 family)